MADSGWWRSGTQRGYRFETGAENASQPAALLNTCIKIAQLDQSERRLLFGETPIGSEGFM
jgi:hypothetical protein